MSHHRLHFLAQRVLNTPLAIHPGKAEVIIAALGHRFGIGSVTPTAGEWWGEDDLPAREPTELELSGFELEEGLAFIPVEGTLVAKHGYVTPMSGMTGYDAIRGAFANALADDRVRAVVLNVDSPGGEVAGCFDLADDIRAARGTKPVWAILTEQAYSAAYALASAADFITVPRTGGAGSIGVIAILMEQSGWLKKEGIAVNIIKFGARKADGNPYEALPDEARATFQAQIDKMGALFVDTVSRNRGLDAKVVRDMEAECFTADDALRLGLVDAVMSPNDAVRRLLASLSPQKD